MGEQENNDFAFIKETIKEKPVNKRRLFKQGLYTALFAALFGLVASFVFALASPMFEKRLYPNREYNPMLFPEDMPATEKESEEQQEANAEAKETETQQTEEVIVTKELELSDYQQLQNKMYAIGKEASSFIVTVTGVVSDTDWYNNPYESQGQASGIILGDNGKELLILTEHKSIKEAESIRATFVNDVTVDAQMKNYDGNTGLAILTVPLDMLEENTKKDISYAVLGNSFSVLQGNVVIAVGSPLGTNYSIATGNVTSVNNRIHTTDNTFHVLTTDITGSTKSSGALLNLNGEIIGLVMQDYSSSSDENTLTGISVSGLKKIVEQLSNGKDIAYLGLKVVTVTDKTAEDYELPTGVYVKEVLLDSPALEAGIQTGDIIVQMDGEELLSEEAYSARVMNLKPEDTVSLAVMRQGADGYTRVECTVTADVLR